MRRFALLLLLLLFGGTALVAQETAAEHLADRAAQVELNESPRDGNIRSYRLPPGDLSIAERLEHRRTLLEFGGTAWGIVSLFLLLHFGVIGRMQRLITEHIRNRRAQGFLFVLLLLGATTLLSLPLDIYSQWLRRQYGLSVQSWASWLGDQAKSFSLAWLFGGLLAILLFTLIRKAPRRWWLGFWLLCIPITIAVSTLR